MLRACFGAGCYWGTEKFFFKDFNKLYPGTIKSGAVGFMGPIGAVQNPAYSEVCSGRTGHVEVYDLEYDGGDTVYEELVKHFFKFHDPTTKNQQGNDMGTQYASVIYCYTEDQLSIAQRVKDELQGFVAAGKVVYLQHEVTTAVLPATVFYPAEEKHQAYLEKNPYGYCNHSYR